MAKCDLILIDGFLSLLMCPNINLCSWDPVFEPLSYNLTYAEMDKDLKNSISHRRKSLELVKEYFDSHTV